MIHHGQAITQSFLLVSPVASIARSLDTLVLPFERFENHWAATLLEWTVKYMSITYTNQ
jgi:hypothetical protein